jgi:hypothetical protein
VFGGTCGLARDGGLAVEGQLEQDFGEFVVAVAEDFAFVEEVAGDGLDAEGADAVEVGFDGGLAFAGVLLEGGGEDGRGVDEGVVEDPGAGVVEDFFDVLGSGEAEGLVGLGHEVADVDAGSGGGGDGFGDAADEEIGDERGVERAGSKGDEVGGGDGVQGFGDGWGVGRVHGELDDGAFGGGDFGFAADGGAVVHEGGEGGVGGGGGKDAAAGGENLRAGLDGLGEVAGDGGERGEEEIAEAVAFEVAVGEAVLEELGEQVLVFREGDHAVADVAWGKHVELFAKAAGGATVVGDGDDGGEIGDEAGGKRAGLERGGAALGRAERGGLDAAIEAGGLAGHGDVALEAAQEGGETGASADGDDAKRLGGWRGHPG